MGSLAAIDRSDRERWTNALDYDLPIELVAQRPCRRRDASRLMIIDRASESIRHTSFDAFVEELTAGDLVVANDSKVIPARLVGRKPSGGRVEILVIEIVAHDSAVAMTRASKPLRVGQSIDIEGVAAATVVRADGGGRCHLDFGSTDARSVVERCGRIPLPPYIRGGEADELDRERYQTVYARVSGSIAAPTAGLHFTDGTIDRIERRGASFRTVTLHVGPGTFTPLRDRPEEHSMESERFMVPLALAADVRATRQRGARVVAVGTTSVRALEAAHDQQEPGCVRPTEGTTDLFLRPGSSFHVVDALLTNFHLPRSTLLCLVMAFGGTELVRRAYEEAVRERYRFYSYGDAMLLV